MTYDEFKQKFLPEFLNINSYAGRIRYANENLQRIGGGSGRIVYDIDGEKVLKLAKNTKGVAQNGAEAGAGYYRDTQHIVTEIFDSADDDTWLISEKAKKVNEKRIKELTGIPSLNDLFYFLKNTVEQNKGGRQIFDQDKKMIDFFWENEFASDLIDFVVNYGQIPGDMGRPSSYGEVLRDGQPTIVLTDYGLNDEVYDTYYSPDRKKSQYQMHELFNYADGNDDILSDTGDQGDIRRGMWAQMPYSASDGQGVINEEFINFVSNRSTYPDKPVSGLPFLTDRFHECVNNIKETLQFVENKEQFYGNLLELQNYLIRRGFYNRDPLLSEEYQINEEIPPVKKYTLDDENYANELAKAVTIKLNLSIPRVIGGGANGFAYLINDNLVMKLTADVSEADAASKLVRGKPQYIATIFNLYKLVDTDTNQSFFVITQENISEKPLEKFRQYQNDINIILPAGMDYGMFLKGMKIPQKFNYDEMVEMAKHILTDNPEANVGELDRQATYEFLIGILNIRKELLKFGIKSLDYMEIANLGYKDNVLKFFDTGGYYGVQEPVVNDSNIIQLPENLTEEQLNEYPREKTDVIANRISLKLGLPEPKYIGDGKLGVAYDIGDNKILKITTDNSEAYENLKLMDKQLKYIAQPYRVFEVKPDNASEGQKKMYAIILEKLKSKPEYFKRIYDRVDYIFKNVFKTNIRDAVDSYLHGYEYDDKPIDKNQVDSYFKKNSEDGEFFFGLVRIAEELQGLGIESYDYFNTDNLGYKPSGALGFFDVGFTDGFAQPHGAEEINVSVTEDGSSKFSTDTAMNQDGFPSYNTNDTSPMINNDLNANVASQMYEDVNNKYLYHASFEQNKESILQNGLIPNYSNNWSDWSEKGYIYLGNTPQLAINWIDDLWKEEIENNGDITELDDIIVFKINVSNLNLEHDLGDNFKFKGEIEPKRIISYETHDVEFNNERIKIIEDLEYNHVVGDATEDEFELSEERKKAWMPGSKAVTVKKKCRLGGNPDGTSVACNQGDINNLEFSSLDENNLEVSEYFSSLVPEIDEGKIKDNMIEAKNMM